MLCVCVRVACNTGAAYHRTPPPTLPVSVGTGQQLRGACACVPVPVCVCGDVGVISLVPRCSHPRVLCVAGTPAEGQWCSAELKLVQRESCSVQECPT